MNSTETLLIEMEKEVLKAYKGKQDDKFTKNFGSDYIGIANDGIKTAGDEITLMHKMNLRELHLTDEKVSFPAENVAVLTYKMVTKGTVEGKEISGSIYTSTVYVNREGNWEAVLHTESIAQAA